ncbi:MAG: beta-galactosidase [Silicimonas sp.]|nr:beta-galactosidase [Silicimonas sp.]
MKQTLGVCYYPEQWPEEMWAEDAARMKAAGLTWVRIGEFAWSRMEPKPGDLQLDWLDRAIDVLGSTGLKVILGTPTATPPRWMLDKHPDMLARGENGQLRKFGSRRHYCFSHAGYREECKRIATILGKRYGRSPHIHAWQIDNEYGCHDTAVSYSEHAEAGFRDWLAQRYQSTDALNRAWGNVFWSMEYADFDEIDMPNLTVTEANPAHRLDFQRYSSDQVVAFNKVQTDALRPLTDAPLVHNYMCRILSFDHFKVAADLDIASWDSYPLGYLLDRLGSTEEMKQRYARQGDPDAQPLHHDLYRAVGKGRMWVMEQQPGPVNWASWNPAPLPGMTRLWAWEAFAHGAEVVSYFRWRQAPFGQEQHHAGLLRPDSADAPALHAAKSVSEELEAFGPIETAQAPVVVLFDYDASWIYDIQPQGEDFSYFLLVLDTYRALRRAGLSIDIAPVDGDLSGYNLIMAPGLAVMSDALKARLAAHEGTVIIGPRAAAKTEHGAIPIPLPPSLPGLDVTVALTESVQPGSSRQLTDSGAFIKWAEDLEGRAETVITREDGVPALVRSGGLHYLGGWPDAEGFDRIIRHACTEAGLAYHRLPEGFRLRDTKTHRFGFNYAPEPVTWNGETLQPGDVRWWPLDAQD